MIFKTWAITLLLHLTFATAHAKAPVWKITKGDQSLFIGGTIHLLSAQDYPLPSAFDLAFTASQQLVFETDVEAVQSFATQARFLPILMYQDGRTLKSEIKPETYTALSGFLSERGLPIALFERFTPAGLNFSLLALELQKLGITGAHGVETHLNAESVAAKKPVRWLESIDQQLGFITRMNQLDADLLINSAIRDTQSLAQQWPKLLTAWRSGDTQALENLAITPMLKESPELYEFILAERNRNWLPDIEAMLSTPEIEFVLVGALHLAGKDSVLTLLEKAGYHIKQLD